MQKISRLGLGCMGMSRSNEAQSIKTIHAAIENGITLLNTGNFYNGGESEIVVGNALRNVPRDKYFLSVKFGVLFEPHGGIYGLDVNPFHVKAQLNYSLHRLGLEYVDLYQPARMDSSIPIEKIMEVLVELKEQGFIRNIGLTEIDAETLVGTGSPEHLQENINALALELSSKDMDMIESIAASHEVYGNEMRSVTFKDGKVCFAG